MLSGYLKTNHISLDANMDAAPDFIVVDTEGSDFLKEIAVIDHQGGLIQQAFVREHPEHLLNRVNVESLRCILLKFAELAQRHLIVCHHADHDRHVLRRAFQAANIPWRPLRFGCTLQLSKRYFPGLPSYSLEYLSRELRLQVNQRYFNPQQAHGAHYDAKFTYQLYQKILEMQQFNPFSRNRVDTPFQDHPDQTRIYQAEFNRLKTALVEIRADRNHQTVGTVIIGEPGSGKTHLIMRLAKELLQVNRLLFVRQPNNPDSVLYHIYSRILDSLIQRVPENNFTQLENLLAHSFTKLISTSQHLNLNKNDQAILEAVGENPLNLYSLAGGNADRRRAIWQHIERRTQEWWMNEYGFAGSAPQIIKGIIKFCSYSDPNRKSIVARWLAANELSTEDLERVGLTQWQEDTNRDAFSLEAISVFSRLSLLDEPMIIVFDQLEGLGEAHNHRLLYSFGEAVKEIFTHVPNSLIIWNLFPDRWQHFQQALGVAVIERISQKIYLPQPDQASLRTILQVRAETVGLDFDRFFTPVEQSHILSQPSIRAALNRAAEKWQQKAAAGSQTSEVPADESQSLEPTISSAPPVNLEQRLSRVEAEINTVQQFLGQLATAFGALQLNGVRMASPAETPMVETPMVETPLHPVSDYLQTQRQSIEQEYSRLQIITDNDDLGKLITIAEAFKTIQPFETTSLQFGQRRLPEHLLFQGQCDVAVGFLQMGGNAFTSRIRNWNQLVVSYPNTQFQLWRDTRLPEITAGVGRDEIERLNHAPLGAFLVMDQEQRLDFELIYRLIVDIQNRDLDTELIPALQVVRRELEASWICQLLHTLKMQKIGQHDATRL